MCPTLAKLDIFVNTASLLKVLAFCYRTAYVRQSKYSARSRQNVHQRILLLLYCYFLFFHFEFTQVFLSLLEIRLCIKVYRCIWRRILTTNIAMAFQSDFSLLFNLSLPQQKKIKNKSLSCQQPRTLAAVTFSPDWPRSTINVKKNPPASECAPGRVFMGAVCVCVSGVGVLPSPTAPEMAPPARPNRP